MTKLTTPRPSHPAAARSVRTPAPPAKAPLKPAKPSKPAKRPDFTATQSGFDEGTKKRIELTARSKDQQVNRDGSTTSTRSSARNGGKTQRSETLTRKDGLMQQTVKHEKTSATGNVHLTTTNEARRRRFVGTESKATDTREVTRGLTTTEKTRSTSTDVFGLKKHSSTLNVSVRNAEAQETARAQRANPNAAATAGGVSVTRGSTTTTGPGNTSQEVNVRKLQRDEARHTTTTTRTTTTGSSVTTSRGEVSKGEEGTASLNLGSIDKRTDKKRVDVSKEREFNTRLSRDKDGGFSQKAEGKLDKLQKAADLADAAGLKKTLLEKKLDDTTGKARHTVSASGDAKNGHFVGTRAGTKGGQELSVGAGGLKGRYTREGVAGAYAEKAATKTGKHGEASVKAQAKAEARAGVDAKGKLDLNGLDATAGAKAELGVEVSLTGRAQTKSVKVAGVDVNAGVEGTAKASAKLGAEATTTVQVLRNPPTAVLEGRAGASAVAKIEGEAKVNAGPFAVKASGYGSAGAEATATGVVGYKDGKFRIGGSAGAALGLGVGGKVEVEVDVKAVATMAKNTADVNGDGKLDRKDLEAVGAKATSAVVNSVSSAKASVGKAASTVRGWMGW